MKKRIFWLLAVLAAMFCVLIMSADAATVVASGNCGDNLAWELDSEGTLSISGKGEMTDDNHPGTVPWYNYRNEIFSVMIEHGVTSIRSYAFNGCNYLINVEIPESVTKIGFSAFYACGSLKNAYYMGNIEKWCSIDFLNDEATPTFGADCLYIDGECVSNISIPYGVTVIKKYAFAWYDGLLTAEIPNTVEKIEDGAFSYCDNLTSIEIPASITSIGNYVFFSNKKLTDIYYGGTAKQWRQISMGTGNSYLTIHPAITVAASISSGDGIVPEFVVQSSPAIGSNNYAIITTGDKTERINQSEWVDGKIVCDMLSMKDMTNSMTINLFDAEGEPLLFDACVFSIYDILNARLDAETDENKAALYRAQLHLGAAVQNFFDYNTDDLANKDLPDAVDDMSAYRRDESLVGGKTPGIICGTSLVLGSKLQMKIYFTSGNKSVLVNGEETELAESAGCYHCTVDVDPADIFDAITIEVRDGTEVVAAGTDSVASYCARLYAIGDKKSKALADALLNYGVTAQNELASNFLYIQAAAPVSTFSQEWVAQIITSDGTAKVVELSDVHNNGQGVATKTPYRFSVDSMGKYVLQPAIFGTVSPGVVIDSTSSLGEYIFDNDTVFVLGGWNPISQQMVYDVLTGITEEQTFVVKTTEAKFVPDSLGRIVILFAEEVHTGNGSMEASSIMTLYKTGMETQITAGNGNVYYSVAAVVDGKVTTVKIADTCYDFVDKGFVLIFGGVTDTNGNYVSLSAVADSGSNQQAWSFTIFKAYENGNVTLDTAKYVEASTPAVVWNLTQNKLQITTIDALYELVANSTGYYTTELSAVPGVQGAITGIYGVVEY